MHISVRKPCSTGFRSLLLAALFPLTGCFLTDSAQPPPLSAEEVEKRRLRTAMDVLKNAMSVVAEERDAFQQKYLNALDEIRTRLVDTEYLESRHRADLKLLTESLNARARAEAEASRLSARLEKNESQIAVGSETNERLAKQLAAKDDELLLLERAVAELTQKAEQEGSAQKELDRLTKELGTARQAAAASAVEAKTLKDKVLTLERLVGSLRDEAKRRPPPEVRVETPVPVVVSPPMPAAEPTPQSSTAFLVDWWTRSVAEIRRGEWNDDNRLLLTLVGSAVVLFCLVLFFMARAASARRRVGVLRKHLKHMQESPPPLRADEISPVPAAAQVSDEVEELAATMALPNPTPTTVDPPRPIPTKGRPLPTASHNPLGDPGAVSTKLDGALGAANQDAPTIMIDPSEGADDLLLNDLKEAIQEKFSELKKRK